MAGTISFEEMIRQIQAIPHNLRLGAWNFSAEVGKEGEKIFKHSFDTKSWEGKPWPLRKEMYKGHMKRKHPLLYETGSLKGSITWDHLGSKEAPAGVKIFTDPNGFGKAKRKYGSCGCYAAVHNGPPDSGPSPFRTKMASNILRRQFMGHCSPLFSKIAMLEATHLKIFPFA